MVLESRHSSVEDVPCKPRFLFKNDPSGWWTGAAGLLPIYSEVCNLWCGIGLKLPWRCDSRTRLFNLLWSCHHLWLMELNRASERHKVHLCQFLHLLSTALLTVFARRLRLRDSPRSQICCPAERW